MTDPADRAARPGLRGRARYIVSTVLASFGGNDLRALVIMTCASIVGRALFSQPINGDFELVEIGCAIAIFAFLPYCQITRSNVIVDFFTAEASMRTKASLDLAGNALFTLIAALITWRAVLGGLDLKRYGETTMILAIPSWWGYVAAVPCAGVLTIVCLYTTWRSYRELTTGRAAPREGPGVV